jgi:DNA-binding MarR family transcriptional regulator
MDELLLSRVRLGVVSHLIAAEWVTFTELQRSIGVTNGNLGTHIGKLVAAKYIKEEKRFEGRRPQSRYRLTKTGRQAFLDHVAALQAVLEPRDR